MLEQIFSVKNVGNHKVVKMLGISCKFRRNQSEEMLKKNKSMLEKSKSMIEKNKKILEELLFYAKRENPHKNLDLQPAQNLKLTMAKLAAEDSARFIMKNCITTPAFKTRNDLHTYALSKVEVEGKYFEFGVWNGNSINYIAEIKPDQIIYGFDSFEGLPEDWQSTYPKGFFKVDNLPAVRENVKLIKGWFDKTLPKFVEENGDFKVAFIHSDSDLYSSTKTTLDCLKDHMQDGTVIIFDELINYPGWEDNEIKALNEFMEENDYTCEYIGYVLDGKQMAIILHKNK